MLGIVNGTTNYILTKMTEEGAAYGDALAEAQRLGFAERDPTADVEGFDAGAKAAIIASIAFGARVVAGDVYHEGISGITAADIEVARRLGYVVKLLAIAELDDSGEIAVRVHPAMVPVHHPLASVRESFNAVFVEGGAVGSLMFYGRGAGGLPDGQRRARRRHRRRRQPHQGHPRHARARSPRAASGPIDETSAEYLLGLEVADRPGVLHAVTGVFADHGVSIRAAEQEGIGDDARLVFITHEAKESAVQATVHGLRELDVVRQVGGLLRVIGGGTACDTSRRAVGRPSSGSPTSARRPRRRRRAVRPGRVAEAAAPASSMPPPATPSRRPPGDRPVRRRRDRPADLARLCDEAYATFRHPAVVPLVQIDDRQWLAELFHGPTLAFKDVALQLVGRLFDHVLSTRGERVTIVGRDERRHRVGGDRGRARLPHVDIVILYPRRGERGPAPADDHGRRPQRPRRRRRGHVRRLPGPRQGDVQRRPVPRACASPRSTRSTGRG